jgi:DNA-binding MarR family transcriptional regulator
MPVPPSILERPGALLVIAARRGQEQATERLEPLGLNVRMCGVLNLLRDQGPMTQHDIGQALFIDRTTMVEMVDELERQGIVRRERSPHDRRAYNIVLTASGKVKQKRAADAFDAAAAEFFSPLTAAELERLGAMLRRLILRDDKTLT